MEIERVDEALELLWVLDEEGHQDVKRFRLSSDDDNVDGLLQTIVAQGHAVIDGEQVRMTEIGTELARGLIRRHRLSERLFFDVFDLTMDEVEKGACKTEHILSEALTDSICTFLGHPATCPHGKPIPRGECCKRYRVDVQPVVTRLTEFEVGKRCKIVFITPSDASRIGRLSSIGIIPGSVIKLIQKKPSVVLQIEETTIAVDPELAGEIYVKRVSES
ncbi:MAG TPA: metal-dependent transcriptional regulator [Dissulfurispiraceae bacterium]|nr:metal-dependent transcriptional regulator [Dissulfurispiraceae bacterium]